VYNGWKNYETWATALWLDNEEGSYTEARSIVAEARDGSDTPDSDAADALKEWAEELWLDPITEGNAAGLVIDLLRGAWSEIDWHEVQAHYVDDE